MSEAILKIRPLIATARRHLREQAFSPSTIEKYNRLWGRLADYMALSGIDIYNRKVGQDFLEHLYGQFSYSRLGTYEKTVVRKVCYLTEFQQNGAVPVK